MKKSIIIHISGYPGSGKTTLGERLEKDFNDIIVYDTDGFIQHHNKAGKKLLALEKNSTLNQYKKKWENTLRDAINKFVNQHKNKIIVFVGSLDNFAPPDTIYRIHANYKFLLNTPLNEILKRYYTRICLQDSKSSEKESHNYWKKVSNNVYRISSSESMVNNYDEYIKWHNDNGYN